MPSAMTMSSLWLNAMRVILANCAVKCTAAQSAD
jgi:hypothetical protein